jgi:VIT1/CCC1 family predicted Fe2+/Mn2+ transporter
MTDADAPAPRGARALDPMDRVSEVLFGLIMVLTFTGSLSVAEAGRAEVREMLVGALGCNFAWGIIDALLFLMGGLADKARGLIAWHGARDAASPAAGEAIVAGALPPVVASLLAPAELASLRTRLAALPAPPVRPTLDAEAWRGAFGIFLLVFVSTLPVVVPFLFVHDAYRALRISNAVAVAMLFLCGYVFGRLTRYHALGTGLAMVLLGSALVAMTMALGG